MSQSLPASARDRHAVLQGIKTNGQAKAGAQDQGSEGRRKLGRALTYAIRFVDWSSKEAASYLNVDPADFGKMLSGNRSVPVDRVLEIDDDDFRWAFIRGLAREDGHETTEEIKRRHPLPMRG